MNPIENPLEFLQQERVKQQYWREKSKTISDENKWPGYKEEIRRWIDNSRLACRIAIDDYRNNLLAI